LVVAGVRDQLPRSLGFDLDVVCLSTRVLATSLLFPDREYGNSVVAALLQ
jgi:hypothetical protein